MSSGSTTAQQPHQQKHSHENGADAPKITQATGQDWGNAAWPGTYYENMTKVMSFLSAGIGSKYSESAKIIESGGYTNVSFRVR